MNLSHRRCSNNAINPFAHTPRAKEFGCERVNGGLERVGHQQSRGHACRKRRAMQRRLRSSNQASVITTDCMVSMVMLQP